MSQWTHVAGAIRLDTLIMDHIFEPSFRERDVRELAIKDLPVGSEGPMKFDFKLTGHFDEDYCTLDFGILYFWGDLRDFGEGNVEEIFDYLQNLVKRLQSKALWVRQCAVVVEVEYHNTYLIQVKGDGDNTREEPWFRLEMIAVRKEPEHE